MFINQLVSLSSKDETEVVKAENNPFDFMAGGQFNNHTISVSPDPVKKLILDINLILHHSHLPR